MTLVLRFRQQLQALSGVLVQELESLVRQIAAPQRYVTLKNAAGTSYYVWVDSTGDVRVGTTAPTDSTESTTGTVVGTQS